MRLTTFASVCGLLLSTTAVAAENQDGPVVQAIASIKTGKLSTRDDRDSISVPTCRGGDCKSCFGEGFRGCPDKESFCYHPDKLGGLELNCYLPGDEEFDDKVAELQRNGELDELVEEIEQFVEDWEDGKIGAAPGLGPQGLLASGVIAAAVALAMM